MAMSLLSLLGGGFNLSAGVGADEAGKVTLSTQGDAAFDTVMAAAELKEISAEQLAAFFGTHENNLSPEQIAKAQQWLQQFGDPKPGQKLPTDLLVTLQEVLPEEVVQVIEENWGAAASPKAMGLKALLDQLPERELTPEELSEIVQQTGLPPVVILNVLQDTPAASPNLAANMVDDMGAAELSHRMPQGQSASTEWKEFLAQLQAAAQNGGEAAKQNGAEQAQNQKPTHVGAPQTEEDAAKQILLREIVQALKGEGKSAEPKEIAAAIQQALQAKGSVEGKQAPTLPEQAQAVTKITEHAAQQPKAQAAVHAAVVSQTPKGEAVGENVVGLTQAPAADGDEVRQAPVTKVNATLQGESATQAGGKPEAGTLNASLTADTSASKEAPAAEPKFMSLVNTPRGGQPQVTDQVLVHVRQAVNSGESEIQIKLHPSELGKVDVKIQVDADGMSRIQITAERKDTLEMLQRDARVLERALTDVGMKTDNSSLSFNLRGDQQEQQAKAQQDMADERQGKGKNFDEAMADDNDEKLSASEMALTYDAGKAYRLNVDWGVDIRA